jgi:valacyclovir hydrolase
MVQDYLKNELFYEDTGNGLPVLLLHGFAGTGRAHFGNLIDTLAIHARVIAPDLRGYGGSAHLPRRFDTKIFHTDAQDLLALIDSLGLAELNIIGYSDGGETAIILAAWLGSRVRSLILWGVSGEVPPFAVINVYADPERFIPEWPATKAELERLHGPGTALPLLSGWASAMRALSAQGGAINDTEARAIVAPTTVIAGTHDPFNPLAVTQALINRIPAAKLIVLPGAGHDLLGERGPQLAALIQHVLIHSRS